MLDNNLKTKEFDNLCLVFSLIDKPESIRNFLSDICTKKELLAMAERLEVAKRIKFEESYRSIAKTVPSSSATITRVAKWMREGSGGYEAALSLLFEHSQSGDKNIKRQ